MDRKLLDRLFGIAVYGLLLASVIFFCIGIFSTPHSKQMLYNALLCSGLAAISALVWKLAKFK